MLNIFPLPKAYEMFWKLAPFLSLYWQIFYSKISGDDWDQIWDHMNTTLVVSILAYYSKCPGLIQTTAIYLKKQEIL
jgi:hypothetical protein